MSSPYAGSDATWPADFPIPDDADPPTAAAVNPGLEGLGDRTAYLKKWIDSLVPLADLAALKAILTPFNGMVRIVRCFGVYVFASSCGLSTLSPYVLVPDDMTTGKWVRAGNSSRYREVAVDITRMLFTTAPNQAARSKSATFSPTTRLVNALVGPGAITDWVHFVDGAIQFVTESGFPNAAYSHGVVYCIDAYLSTGCVILNVNLDCLFAPGRGALPAHPVSVGVFRCPVQPGSGAPKVLERLTASADFLEDDSVNVAAYESRHTFGVDCDQNNIVNLFSYTYFVQVWNEYGSNCVGGNFIAGLSVATDKYSDAYYTASGA